jgi:hypothetical protein
MLTDIDGKVGVETGGQVPNRLLITGHLWWGEPHQMDVGTDKWEKVSANGGKILLPGRLWLPFVWFIEEVQNDMKVVFSYVGVGSMSGMVFQDVVFEEKGSVTGE